MPSSIRDERLPSPPPRADIDPFHPIHAAVPRFRRPIRDILEASVAKYFDNEDMYRESVARCPNMDPQLRKLRLAASLTTTAGMQTNIDFVSHVDPTFDPEAVYCEMERDYGEQDTLRADLMVARDPGVGSKKIEHAKQAEHYAARLRFM